MNFGFIVNNYFFGKDEIGCLNKNLRFFWVGIVFIFLEEDNILLKFLLDVSCFLKYFLRINYFWSGSGDFWGLLIRYSN